MNISRIEQMISETAYIRPSGSPEERKCAQYLAQVCESYGVPARVENYSVPFAKMYNARLLVDGRQVACTGYLRSGSFRVEGPLYYLTNRDPWSLNQCCGKIVLTDGPLTYDHYQDLFHHGALGFITYCGDVSYSDCDIDERELRAAVSQGKIMPGVVVNAKDAVEIVRSGARAALIDLEQEEWTGTSCNVVAELPGEVDQWINFSAHFDTTSLSCGAYDNMSGCIGLMGILEHFAVRPHRYGLRFVWCGSEERGLLGSIAYCAEHEAQLEKILLDVNLDMIGSVMGGFVASATAEEKLIHYVEYLACEVGFGLQTKTELYPSDSSAFADKGIPAITFARSAPSNTATIHNRYDTASVISAERIRSDTEFIITFTERMANAKQMPVKREIPEKWKSELEYFFNRKRRAETVV